MMQPLNREEKIKLLIQLIDEVEGAIVAAPYFESYTDEQLDKEIQWYEYLSEK